MKKTKPFRLAAMTASLFCALTLFTIPAYAQSSEPQPETTPPPAETEAQPETQNPFYPGWHRNGGGQRHRPGRQGILYHYHSG